MTFSIQVSARTLIRRRILSIIRRCFAPCPAALAAGVLFAAASLCPAAAATFAYTGGAGTASAPVTGNFSTGFNPGVVGSTASDTLSFAGISYTATDDLTQQILANMLTFTNSGAVTLARGGAGTNNSISLGGTTPKLATGTGAVVNNLDLSLTSNTTLNIGAGGFTQNGIISGSAGITLSGIAVFTGLNTYSGSTTLNNGSIVTVGIASVTDNSGATSGGFGNNSAVTLITNSTVFLTNNSTSYNTQFGSLAGNGNVKLGTATLTIGGDNISTNYAGIISGSSTSSKLIKIGSGTLTLSGANTYSGTTTISGGTLSATTSSFSTAYTATILDNSTLDIGGSTGTFSNVISGTGSVTVGGNTANLVAPGTIITFANPDTYTGGTTVNTGTLSGATASYGTGNVTVNSSGTVDYTQGSINSTYAANISGAGSVTIGGQGTSSGTLTYTGQDSAATTIKTGKLALSNPSGPALSGPVAVATGGTLTINSNATNNEIATAAPPSTAPTTAAVTLSGGTLSANGSDGTVDTPTSLATAKVTASMGALALGANGTSANPSVLAFAAGTASQPFVLAFADSKNTLGSGYLNITGYTGTTNALYIGTTADLSTAQLAQISFNGLKAGQLTNGEIVALAAAPEPSGWLTLLVGAAALGGLAQKRKAKSRLRGLPETGFGIGPSAAMGKRNGH